jgi:phosphate starvation-inducible PhoH-like protein
MTKRRSSSVKAREFVRFIDNNPIPIPTAYNQKKFSSLDLVSVAPKTLNQKKVFDMWSDDYSMILAGSAGSGKSFVALYLSLCDVLDKVNGYEKIIIVRSAVQARDQGFVPGTQEEKNAIYELPYTQLFNDLFKKTNQYKHLKEAGVVEFHTTGNIRGVTWDNSIVIFDEMQNANYEELSTVATRIGKHSKLIYCGDMAQNDLHRKRNDQSGFTKFVKIASTVPSFRSVFFGHDDIVRSGFVREFIIAEEMWNEANPNG